MNGPNEIRNINTHRTRQAIEELRVKAESAKKQNHPLAEQFASKYESLKAEVDAGLH